MYISSAFAASESAYAAARGSGCKTSASSTAGSVTLSLAPGFRRVDATPQAVMSALRNEGPVIVYLRAGASLAAYDGGDTGERWQAGVSLCERWAAGPPVCPPLRLHVPPQRVPQHWTRAPPQRLAAPPALSVGIFLSSACKASDPVNHAVVGCADFERGSGSGAGRVWHPLSQPACVCLTSRLHRSLGPPGHCWVQQAKEGLDSAQHMVGCMPGCAHAPTQPIQFLALISQSTSTAPCCVHSNPVPAARSPCLPAGAASGGRQASSALRWRPPALAPASVAPWSVWPRPSSLALLSNPHPRRTSLPCRCLGSLATEATPLQQQDSWPV